jgi:hypothetical protein
MDVVAGRLARQYPATDKGVTVRVVPERLARPQPFQPNPKSQISASDSGTSFAELPNPHNAAPQRAATGGGAPGDGLAPEPEFLTVSEVALRLRVSRNWVYNHAHLLGVYHLGKYLRFSWPKVLERLGANRDPHLCGPNKNKCISAFSPACVSAGVEEGQ